MKIIIIIISCLAIFYSIFTPFKLFFSGGEASLFVLALTLLLLQKKLYFKIPIVSCIIYCIVILFLDIVGYEYYSTSLPFVITLAFSVFLFYYYTTYNANINIIMYVYFSSMIILSIISIVLLYQFPSLMRNFSEESTQVESNIFFWIVNYSQLHQLPFFLPMLIFIIKNSKVRFYKYFAIFTYLLFFILIIKSNATTPLILALISGTLPFIINDRKTFKYNLKLIIVVLLLSLLIINKFVILEMLYIVQPYFEGTGNYQKVNELIVYFQFGSTEGDLGARESLYLKSFYSFLENPLLGNSSLNKIGRHSFLIDTLAVTGIFFFIPIAIFMFVQIKYTYMKLSKTKIYFLFSVLTYILMALTKSSLFCFSAYFMIPALCIMLEKDFLINKFNNNDYIKKSN